MDLVRFSSGTEFPDKRAISGEMREEGRVVKCSREWSAVIAGGPFDIMHVATDDVRRDGFQPFFMIEKPEVVFELNMAEVVPIADPWMFFEMFLKFQHFAFVGHVFEA